MAASARRCSPASAPRFATVSSVEARTDSAAVSAARKSGLCRDGRDSISLRMVRGGGECGRCCRSRCRDDPKRDRRYGLGPSDRRGSVFGRVAEQRQQTWRDRREGFAADVRRALSVRWRSRIGAHNSHRAGCDVGLAVGPGLPTARCTGRGGSKGSLRISSSGSRLTVQPPRTGTRSSALPDERPGRRPGRLVARSYARQRGRPARPMPARGRQEAGRGG